MGAYRMSWKPSRQDRVSEAQAEPAPPLHICDQKLIVTLNRTNRGATMAFGRSHVAPLVGQSNVSMKPVVSSVLNKLYRSKPTSALARPKRTILLKRMSTWLIRGPYSCAGLR